MLATVIVRDKDICGGSPRIKGTRLTVVGILEYLACGFSVERIVKNANASGIKITKKHIQEAILFSTKQLRKND